MRILHVGYGFRPWREGGLIAYAEDVMEAQAASGHEVGYFFRGRHYPWLDDDRVRGWTRRGVRMYELVNSSLVTGVELGTLTPRADLDHAPSERHFRRVLDLFRPDVIHVQELTGLPSSLLELAAVPVVATLQDYFPLCPVVKLYDVDGQICLRREPGAQCARCCAEAPAHSRRLRYFTVQHELARFVGAERAERTLGTLKRPRPESGLAEGRTPSARAYQDRRDVNVERLSRVDALVAQSQRVAEIYTQLGVDEDRVRVLRLTPRHIEALTPRAIDEPPAPVRFVTPAGAASVEKGSELLLEALALLAGERFTLTVLGGTSEETAERLRRFPQVELAGRYRQDELDALLDRFDVGIVPSVWEEAYGYVGPELLAKGIPVIGNALGGIPEYTRDGETGWLNHRNDAAGLAEIVRAIIREPAQVCERSAWIRGHRDEVIGRLDDHLAELEALYQEVAGAWSAA